MKIILCMLVVVLISGCTLKEKIVGSNTATVCFEDNCFISEIADDAEERRVGLMNREKLEEDTGMLFVFEEPKPRISFWMKNTLIPLDMIRLDTSGHVVYLEQNVPPCENDPCPTYGPKAASIISKYILELNAGEVSENNIKVGDVITIAN